MYLVSACLMGVNCKYNGENNKNDSVINFLSDKEYMMVCPETAGGLHSPRDPSERVGDKVISSKGLDVTKEFNEGCKKCLKNIEGLKIDLAILKKNSPSCGFGTIYDGTFSHKIIPGNGVFSDELNKLGIKIVNEEEIK